MGWPPGTISLDLNAYAEMLVQDVSTVRTQFGVVASTEVPVGRVECSRRKAGGPHAGSVRINGVTNR